MTNFLFSMFLNWYVEDSIEGSKTLGFEISLLSPNGHRRSWAALMAEELPKIGIGIRTHSCTGWDVIGPRTFSHERDDSSAHVDGNGNSVGVIPTYDERGFDLFFVGLSGAIDYNPTSSYSNELFSPDSNNFASYDNDEISALITQYTSELDSARRSLVAPAIQRYMYDDLPYIGIINTAGLWAYDASWTKLTSNDLLFFGTTNAGDWWKDIEHDTKTNLVYAHPYELTEFTPFAIQSYIASQYLNPIYPGLYERDINDPNLAYQPVIAASLPTWNTEKTVATIDINPAARFSTGEQVTAIDVVNSFHMHMSPAWSVGSYAGLSTYIANNDSVRLVDSDTVEITLNEPYFLAYQLFSVPIFDMTEIGTPSATFSYGGITAVGPKGDGENGFDFNTEGWKFHGAGPFTYDEDATGHGIDATAGDVKLVANPDYWRGSPKLNSIQFNKYGSKEAALSDLQGGKIEIIDAEFYLEPGEVEGIAGVAYQIIGDFGTQMMVVNMDHPILGTGVDTPLGRSDPTRAEEAARHIRQAISHIVPREDIVDTILKGVGSPSTILWPELAVGYNNSLEPHEYSKSTANDLLKQAGYGAATKTSMEIIDEYLSKIFWYYGVLLLVINYIISKDGKRVIPEESNLELDTDDDDSFYPESENDERIYLSSLGLKVRPCCYQTARLAENYCMCGRYVDQTMKQLIDRELT
ncbi:MAG: ABC transporter substrate-binding protein [Candidatus Kariarchaeaceae archaeon]